MSKEVAAAAAAWFSEALGQPCKLVRQQQGSRHALSASSRDEASESQDGSSDSSSVASAAALGMLPVSRFSRDSGSAPNLAPASHGGRGLHDWLRQARMKGLGGCA